MEAAGVLSITFGLFVSLPLCPPPKLTHDGSGFTLSTTIHLLPAHITRHYHQLLQPLQLTYTLFVLPLLLWSFLQFSSFLILTTLPCSILSVLVSLTDQLARVALTALILFSVRPPIHNTGERAVLLLFVALRAVLAAAVVGFTRSEFVPVCFPVADQGVGNGRAPGITQVCFDGLMMAISFVRAWVAWRRRGSGRGIGGLVAIVAAAMAWMAAAGSGLVRVGSVLVRVGPGVVTLGVLLGELMGVMLAGPGLMDGHRTASSIPRCTLPPR